MDEHLRKAIGYAFTDLTVEGGIITDPRINPAALENIRNRTFGSYLEHIEGLTLNSTHYQGTDLGHLADLGFYLTDTDEREEYLNTPLSETMTCNPADSEIGNVLCLTPVSFAPDWIRDNDRIDVLERKLRDRSGSKLVERPENHYPFSGGFTNRETREHVSGFKPVHFKSAVRRHEFAKAHKLAQDLGFTSATVADRLLIPQIPDDVRLICQYVDLLTDEKHLYDMKPVYITMVTEAGEY